MKFSTLSLVVGNAACNAHCPFCVAKMSADMTPVGHVATYNNLETACRLAQSCGVTTCLLTGKGEPTLFPNIVKDLVIVANKYFPLIELQTNGLILLKDENKWIDIWKSAGLTTIALSIVHYQDEMNHKIYCGGIPQKKYPNLSETIKLIHERGLSVRLSCVGIKGYIDCAEQLEKLVEFAQKNSVEQLTWRPVATPDYTRNDEVSKAARELAVDSEHIQGIIGYAKEYGTLLLNLPHGAQVYDMPVLGDDDIMHGQNLCLSNCLTETTDPENIRQLIWAAGKLRYSWTHEGAIIL